MADPQGAEKGGGGIRGMFPGAAFWQRAWGSRARMELTVLAFLGAATFQLFRQAPGLSPLEGTLMMMAAMAMLILGRRWWEWQRRLSEDGFLEDWIHRILAGERDIRVPPMGLRESDRRMASALRTLTEELRQRSQEAAGLRLAAGREWRELDALLHTLERGHGLDKRLRMEGAARIESLGREIRTVLEGHFKLDQLEMKHRLQSDQHRIQGQAFQTTLGQIQAGLEQFEGLLSELQGTFPQLRREEDALGRLADAGLRQGARLGLAVKGLVAHASRLGEEIQKRTDWLRRFRLTADGVRDRAEALARRIEGFREETQGRIRSFDARGAMKGLDQVAQQTGLLAVNAAILAQHEGGREGMAAIGGRLRSLADLTAEGASDMERILDQHHEGMEREEAGLWDLQEATGRLLSETQELLQMAGQLDQQSHDLDRSLEAHLGLVDRVRQVSERAGLSLHMVGERAFGLESALGHQWGVMAKIIPERERLSRVGARMGEVGGELARISQRSIDGAREMLQSHREIRQSGAYRQIAMEPSGHDPALTELDLGWSRVGWARALRRPRLVGVPEGLPPLCRIGLDGACRMALLGQDAFGLPEPSALQSWDPDPTGQIWRLGLRDSLRAEEYRLVLLDTLNGSPLSACFPGLEVRITQEGVEAKLPIPYPGLPVFLSGLDLELPLQQGAWEHPVREWEPSTLREQSLLWIGPDAGGGPQHPCLRLIHAWVRDDPDHERFLPWLSYEGYRPRCSLLSEEEAPRRLGDPIPARCLSLGADPTRLHPLWNRLLQAGAVEGLDGAVLCNVAISHAHPEALLLRLFQADAGLAGVFHPELVPYQARLRDEVLSGTSSDPHRAAWSLLEDLQREGWVMPLPQ